MPFILQRLLLLRSTEGSTDCSRENVGFAQTSAARAQTRASVCDNIQPFKRIVCPPSKSWRTARCICLKSSRTSRDRYPPVAPMLARIRSRRRSTSASWGACTKYARPIVLALALCRKHLAIRAANTRCSLARATKGRVLGALEAIKPLMPSKARVPISRLLARLKRGITATP